MTAEQTKANNTILTKKHLLHHTAGYSCGEIPAFAWSEAHWSDSEKDPPPAVWTIVWGPPWNDSTFSPAAPTHVVLVGFLNTASLDLRLAVGKSEDEVGDVVLPSFFRLTQSTRRDFFVIL